MKTPDARYYQQFVGKRIKGIEFVEIPGGRLPTLLFEDGTFSQIWSDPEGSSIGRLGLYDESGNEIYPSDVDPGVSAVKPADLQPVIKKLAKAFEQRAEQWDNPESEGKLEGPSACIAEVYRELAEDFHRAVRETP